LSTLGDIWLDLGFEANAELMLRVTYRVDTAPAGPVMLAMGRGKLGANSLFTGGEGWRTVLIPLKCFAGAGGDMRCVEPV